MSDTDNEEGRPHLDGTSAMRKFSIAAVATALLVVAPQARSSQHLALHVSPIVAMAPAALTIRTTIEPNDDNRMLTVVLDSGDYG
jgi:hypothetical protein